MSSREIYKNAWLRLREDRVIRPDGRPGIYSVVELPRSAGIVAVDSRGNVLLVGQWRYTHSRFSWEIPTGGAEGHERALSTARRELAEESGLAAADWVKLGCIQNSNGATTDLAHLFLARRLSPSNANVDKAEGIRTRWVPFRKALALVLSGRITESSSVAALLMAEKLMYGPRGVRRFGSRR